MNNIKSIFFDLDGTLINSIDAMYAAYLSFLNVYGIHGTKEEFDQLNGPSLREIVKHLKEKYMLPEPFDVLLKTYLKQVESAYQKSVLPFEDSTKVLKELKTRNLQLSLVTSNSKSIVRPLLKKLGWQSFFSVIIYGDDVKNAKPFPDIYKLCLERSKANKNNVLVIEDSANGFESAQRAGLRCILFNPNEKKLDNIFNFLYE
jgi:HAD superfamily hydrolase (TIGR01509 family)